MIGPHFYDEMLAKEKKTGLKLVVDNVAWNVNDPDRGLDPLPTTLTAAQRTAIEEVVAAHDPNWVSPLAYRERRAAAYPPIGDQLDALWKGGEAADDMRLLILAVKYTYPKPKE